MCFLIRRCGWATEYLSTAITVSDENETLQNLHFIVCVKIYKCFCVPPELSSPWKREEGNSTQRFSEEGCWVEEEDGRMSTVDRQLWSTLTMLLLCRSEAGWVHPLTIHPCVLCPSFIVFSQVSDCSVVFHNSMSSDLWKLRAWLAVKNPL